MEFYINGNLTDVTLEEEKTVGDVLTSFARTCDENRAAVTGIVVNGKQITADIFDEEAKADLTSDTKFEFDVITENAVKESFEKLSELFNSLSTEMEEIPSLFMNGKGSSAHESIKRLADSIDQFCHIAALASLFPETFTNTKIADKSFSDFFEEFSPVLADFEGALQANDTVLVGDLCEYEICPRLREISKSLSRI